MAIDECRSLYEGTKIYGNSVKAFLVEIRKTEEASRNPILGASVAAARIHFFAVQRELQRVWELYERLSIQQQRFGLASHDAPLVEGSLSSGSVTESDSK